MEREMRGEKGQTLCDPGDSHGRGGVAEGEVDLLGGVVVVETSKAQAVLGPVDEPVKVHVDLLDDDVPGKLEKFLRRELAWLFVFEGPHSFRDLHVRESSVLVGVEETKVVLERRGACSRGRNGEEHNECHTHDDCLSHLAQTQTNEK